MRDARLQLGIVAFAAVALALVLMLLFRSEVPEVTLNAASPEEVIPAELQAVVDATVAPSDARATSSPAPPCVASDPATPSAAQQRAAAEQARVRARNLAQARERLLVSRDAEHLAAAALLSRNARNRVDDITKALSTGRNNASVVWAAVRICDGSAGNVDCPAQRWEDELLRLDGQNSEVWINVAVRRLERGDADKALEAMQRAAAAPETRDYWPEMVELLERGLDAAGGYSFSERASAAFGVAAANLPNYSRYVNLCKAQSQINRAWADACLLYGETAERQGKTVAGQTFARSIQIAVLEVIGDDDTFGAARRRRENVTAQERGSVDDLIVSGPRQFARYLAKVRESGESAALAEMLEEARFTQPMQCLPAR